MLLLDPLIDCCWQGAKKLVEGIASGVVFTVLLAGAGVQALWQQVILPLLGLLAEACKLLWRELYFWSVGDAEQD